jgi:hypothetical protein
MKLLRLEDGEFLFIGSRDGHLWMRDWVGDEVLIARTRTDLETFISCLRQMAEDLPE